MASLNPGRYVPFCAKYTSAELGTGSAPVGFALFRNLWVVVLCQMGRRGNVRGNGTDLSRRMGRSVWYQSLNITVYSGGAFRSIRGEAVSEEEGVPSSYLCGSVGGWITKGDLSPSIA